MRALCAPGLRPQGDPPCSHPPYLCYLPHLSAPASHLKLHQAHFPPGRGNRNPLQYSCLGNPMHRGAWRATVHGVTRESDMTEHNKVIPNRTSTTSPAQQCSTQQTCSLSWITIRSQTLHCFRILYQGVLCVIVLVAQSVSDSLQPHELQAPLSMEFPRQEYYSELPFPSPGDLPNPGIEPRSPAMQLDSLPSEPPGKPLLLLSHFSRVQLCAAP